MLECHYKKEPLDIRLVMLRLWKQAGIILAGTLLGTLIFGGGYYLRNVALPPTQYAATSLYYVEYMLPPNTDSTMDAGYSYINHETWNRWMDTREFLDLVYRNLEGTPNAQIDRETMKSYLSAELLTDLKMPDTIVTTPDPELTLRIAAAVEKSILSMVGEQYGIESIRVVDPAVSTSVFNESRPLNACILSAVVSFVFVTAVLALKEIGSDSILLPATLSSRYGLKSLGTVHSKAFDENVRYILRDCAQVGILPVGDVNLKKVTGRLAEAAQNERTCLVALPELELCPEACETIRGLDGLVLAVESGAGSGKRLEEVLELLAAQDCRVSAALLWEADERLIRRYYWKETLIGGKG